MVHYSTGCDQGAAMGAANALTADGLFIGQSKQFFKRSATSQAMPMRPGAGSDRTDSSS